MSNWRQALRRFAKEVLDVRDLVDPFGVRPEHRLAEDAIPSDAQGRRDDRAYTRPIEHYRHLYEAFLASKRRRLTPREANLAWRQRVHGAQGLAARGAAAIPYALELLRGSDPDGREDGADILTRVGAADTSVDALLDALAAETDDVARTSLFDALGHTRSKRAAVALETVIANPTTDAEHRETAARSLRRIRESR
jgi:hypothetical protein